MVKGFGLLVKLLIFLKNRSSISNGSIGVSAVLKGARGERAQDPGSRTSADDNWTCTGLVVRETRPDLHSVPFLQSNQNFHVKHA